LRYRKLTDVAQQFQGQRIISVLRNQEDSLLFKERLKVIKDADISDHKSIEDVDFESMKDEQGNLLSHIIVISDDIRQF
jgi:hypothetical protein